MVKKDIAYICEKCGYSIIGEQSKEKIEKHEKIPVTNICDSLDGLVVEINNEYAVFRRIKKAHLINHDALYNWKKYLKKTLLLKKPHSFGKEIDKVLANFSLFQEPEGYRAHDAIGMALYNHHSETSWPIYEELTEPEFKKVTTTLRRLYPDLYGKTKFQRNFKKSIRKVKPNPLRS